MAINVNIAKVEITGVTISTSPESLAAIQEELVRGVDPEALSDLGHLNVPTEITSDEATADLSTVDAVPDISGTSPEPASDEEYEERAEIEIKRFTEAEINANARKNFLYKVIRSADEARRLEGFQTNWQHRPNNLAAVNTKQMVERAKAESALKLACGHCALKQNCSISENLEKWLDLHPYKDEPSKKRPGSLRVKTTESRTDFIEALREDPRAHCVPSVRRRMGSPKPKAA